jgi:hypothetical protein
LAASEGVKKSTPTQLSLAAAADLTFALDDLMRQFEDDHPATKVTVTYGSSGNFFAQLQSGAPFDLFFSADMAYPRKLAEGGLGADEVFFYAIGQNLPEFFSAPFGKSDKAVRRPETVQKPGTLRMSIARGSVRWPPPTRVGYRGETGQSGSDIAFPCEI